jgi:hypothetical protein
MIKYYPDMSHNICSIQFWNDFEEGIKLPSDPNGRRADDFLFHCQLSPAALLALGDKPRSSSGSQTAFSDAE